VAFADLDRRAEVSQDVNDRYLDTRARTDDTPRLKELLAPLERPVIRDGKGSRALRPFDDPDRLLLEAISGERFIINGFRNKICKNCCIRAPRNASTIASPLGG
jgi:hypothetical protein